MFWVEHIHPMQRPGDKKDRTCVKLYVTLQSQNQIVLLKKLLRFHHISTFFSQK